MRLAGAVLAACLGLAGCTGRDILAMRSHPAPPQTAAVTAPAAPFKGPAISATTTYPKDENAPRPAPPAEFASLKNPLAATADNIAKGKAIFDANCAICHGTTGQGNGGAAASLNPKPANFTTAIHTRLPDGYWFWRISKGGSVPPFSAASSAMPPWETSLSAQQRWEIILFEHTFSRHP
ncbi:MAG TPA: c-type cytochrome [bacterium]|nr:c-type cytochrome [bacterium]